MKASARNQFPGHPACSIVTIPTALLILCYVLGVLVVEYFIRKASRYAEAET
jgi:hypothetical protein